MQRTTLYSCMNTAFLRELAENINLSFRSHAETDRGTLVKLLDKKISPEKADTVFKMYLTCFNAQEVAQIIKPKGMEEIVVAVKNFFKASFSACLYEVTIGSRRCDIVFLIKDKIIAVEVKSSQDQMKSADSQLKDYATWANEVFLAYDTKHRRMVDGLGFREKGIGLLEFSNEKIRLIENASFQEKDSEYFLSLLTYAYLTKIARQFNVSAEGKKRDIAKKLSREISTNTAKTIFKDFIKTRALR